MYVDYYELPFGAQLLLWTSRIALLSNCRVSPNKYEVINIAFERAGIQKGGILLKSFLSLIKHNKNFKFRRNCSRCLLKEELDLINCINMHKLSYFDNKFYIELWGLESNAILFTTNTKKLATAFKNANLATKINYLKYDETHNKSIFSRDLH